MRTIDLNAVQKEKVLTQIKDFLKANTPYWEIDKTDFRRSKNLSTGNLWYERLGRSWGEARANVTHNPVQPIVDSTCNAFLRNPYSFEGIPDEQGKKINEVLFKCLREVCNDGLSYFYIYHDENSNLHFEHLHNMNVIYDFKNSKCLTIKKKTVEPSERRLNSLINDLESLNLAFNETVVLTYFECSEGKCNVTKLEGEDIVDTMQLNIPTLPIIQIKGKSCWISNDFHYRGYYYQLQDLIAILCANWSVSAERIIARDPVMLPAESLGDSQFIEQWKSNEPRNFYTYQSFELDNSGGVNKLVPLNKPEAAPNSTDIQKLEATRASIYEAIDRTVGSQYASENAGNETATAVLLRNQNKEDALSELLWNLNHAAIAICRVIESYILWLAQTQIKITVKDNFSEGIKNTNSVQLLLSIAQMPARMQLAIMTAYNAPDTILTELKNLVAKEEQAQQTDIEKEQLARQNQMLIENQQIMEQRHAAQLQQVTDRNENERLKMENDFIKAKADYELKLLKLQQEQVKIDANIEKERDKVTIEAAKAQADIVQSVV